VVRQVIKREMAFAFWRSPLADGEQSTQPPVRVHDGRIDEDAAAWHIDQSKPRSKNELEPASLAATCARTTPASVCVSVMLSRDTPEPLPE